MGQKQTQSNQQQLVTYQQVQQSIKSIFDHTQTKYQPMQVAIPIKNILQNLSSNIPAQKTQQGFVLNHKMIQIFYHKQFLFSMGKLINLLIDKLQQIGQRSSIMVQRDQWMFCLNLANFIIFFTDDKLIRMMETVNIRSDLSQNTKKYIDKIQKQGNQFSATQSLIDKLSFSQIQRIQKCFRIIINQMISMKTQVITRSQMTLKIIQKLQQSCFILYLKALYSPQHSQSILNKAKHPQFLRSNLIIGHYFIGKGCDLNIASVYQSGVLFLSNLIQKNKSNLKQFKSLPTHLFKTLPIVSQNTIYDFIMNICLFSLTYIKQNNNLYSRFSFNRLMTLKLLQLIVKQVKVTSPQITYYLEQICLQTRIGMIQRSFVTDLVQNYINLVHQSIDQNKIQQKSTQSIISKNKQINSQNNSQIVNNKQTSLKFIRQSHVSQILTKYLQAGKQNYNIKYSNKKYKITTVDIVTQLQNDENIIQTQFRILCEKYIYEVILGKRVIYQYSDRQIWSQILPNILEDKCNSSGDQAQNGSQQDEGNKNYKSNMIRQDNEVIKNSWSINNNEEKNIKDIKTEIINTPPKKKIQQQQAVEIEQIQPQTIQVLNSNKNLQTPANRLNSQSKQQQNYQKEDEKEEQQQFQDIDENQPQTVQNKN